MVQWTMVWSGSGVVVAHFSRAGQSHNRLLHTAAVQNGLASQSDSSKQTKLQHIIQL